MPDSSAVDVALLAKLNGDATLIALMPGGAWWDGEAPAALTKFVTVGLVDAEDEAQFGGRAWEDNLYLVKAVELKPSSGSGNIKAAADRIDALLDPQPPLQPATLTVAGYTLMTVHREGRVRYPDNDEADESIRFRHRGGRYRVQVSVGT